MTAKEYLQQLRDLKTIIDLQEKKRQRLLDTAKSIQFPVYGVKVRANRSTDQIPKLIAAADDLEHKNLELRLKYALFQNEVINQIQMLDDPIEMQLLFSFYVEYKKLAVIAVEMDYTYQYVRLLHGHALQDFAEIHPILNPFDF